MKNLDDFEDVCSGRLGFVTSESGLFSISLTTYEYGIKIENLFQHFIAWF